MPQSVPSDSIFDPNSTHGYQVLYGQKGVLNLVQTLVAPLAVTARRATPHQTSQEYRATDARDTLMPRTLFMLTTEAQQSMRCSRFFKSNPVLKVLRINLNMDQLVHSVLVCLMFAGGGGIIVLLIDLINECRFDIISHLPVCSVLIRGSSGDLSCIPFVRQNLSFAVGGPKNDMTVYKTDLELF